MALQSLRDLYIDELQDLYDAERQIIQALPGMARSAGRTELKQAFEEHAEQTRLHIERLDRILAQVERPAPARQCDGVAGILQEGAGRADQGTDSAVRDAALIGTAQRIEHYEMAAYGCARTYARELGLDEAAALLQQTLDEEGAADQRLSALAESRINGAARARGAGAGSAAGDAERARGGAITAPENTARPGAGQPAPRPHQVDNPEWVLSHGRATVGHRMEEPRAMPAGDSLAARADRGDAEPRREPVEDLRGAAGGGGHRRQRLDEDFDGEQSER